MNKPLRVAMYGHKRVPGREGGVETVVEELGSRLAALGCKVTLFNRRRKGVETPAEYKGMRIYAVPTIDKKSLDAVIASVCAAFRAAFGRYDVVHVHAEGPCATLWLPKLLGKRVVATIHGLDWQRAKWGGFATRYLKYGERVAARHADEIIVLSREVQRYFAETYHRETRLIANGVNLPAPVSEAPIGERFGLRKDGYVLFLARIVPEKGLHYLLKAFAALDTPLKLVVAGDSSHTDEYMARIRAQAAADSRVVFTGFVSGDVLASLYENARLYVLPSDVEGMPLTLLEALVHGAPCLVSDIPENVDVLPAHMGRSFAHGDVGALTVALKDALTVQPPTAAERSAQAQSVASAHDWNDVARETLAVYEGKAVGESLS